MDEEDKTADGFVILRKWKLVRRVFLTLIEKHIVLENTLCEVQEFISSWRECVKFLR